MKDLDALSTGYESGGASGRAGSNGAASGGKNDSAGGDGPNDAGASGEGGETSEPGSGGHGGSCKEGVRTCPGTAECVDLDVGTPDGDGVTNCGACGTTCSLDHADSATCKVGVCEPLCESDFGDCNTSADNDGCETELTTITNCGACDHACSVIGATNSECTAGQCAPTCAPPFADCNSGTSLAQDDGCEVFLDTLDHCMTSCNAAPVACDPTMVCNAGSCVAPDGVVALSTPLTLSSDAQRFSDVFPANPVNLEDATVTVRVYVPGATGGTLGVFLSDIGSNFAPQLTMDLTVLSEKWTDITVQATSAGAFSAKTVKQLNLLVQGGAGTLANPTIVYVDSVRDSKQVINDDFDSSYGGFSKSTLVFVAGSTITWSAAMP
jgi:hypothetical protein